MMMMGLFSGISEDVANFFRDFLWKLIETEIDCVRNLINALVNGVLSFGILDNTWIQDGYKAAITLMFIILPAKIIYEFIFAMVREDDNASDVNKKLGGAIMGVMLAVSLSIVVPLANNLSINSIFSFLYIAIFRIFLLTFAIFRNIIFLYSINSDFNNRQTLKSLF